MQVKVLYILISVLSCVTPWQPTIRIRLETCPSWITQSGNGITENLEKIDNSRIVETQLRDAPNSLHSGLITTLAHCWEDPKGKLEMNLNDLLRGKGIDPQYVLVLRHRPREPELNKVLPWLAAERPDLFNAYQQTQGERLERVMQATTGVGHVASFIGREPGKALFVGLYSIGEFKPLTYDEYWKIPANIELKAFGHRGFTGEKRPSILWFDLVLTDYYAHWKGKLIIGWPGKELAWWRRAHKPKNEMPVLAILEDSALDTAMPQWDEIELSWEELDILPMRWKSELSRWPGIYYIFDTSDGKGYVGSAYGEGNLLGRWLNYAAHGHGDNRLLRQRDPRNFRFTILQLVAPGTNPRDVIRLEGSWKQRLHTRKPYGLNEN
jgi:hypothetical protein